MYLLKYKELFTKSNLEIPGPKVKGQWRLVIRDPHNEKRVKYDSGWFDNIITDWGLQIWNSSQAHLYQMVIGSGTTPPTRFDTALEAQIGLPKSQGQAPNPVYTNTETYPGLQSASVTASRFDQTYVGTIAEVGYISYAQPQSVTTRALVPTPYNKTADEIADVYYKVTTYRDNLYTGSSGQVSISGVTYDYILKPMRLIYPFNYVTQACGYQYMHAFSGVDEATNPALIDHCTMTALGEDPPPNDNGGYTHPGYMQTTNRSLNLTVDGANDRAWADTEWYAGLIALNCTDPAIGVRGLSSYWSWYTNPGFYMVFNDPNTGLGIPKDRTNELYITCRFTWGR